MKRIALSLLLLFVSLMTAYGHRKQDDFSLHISLTSGESSRDSHAETATITVNGSELVYEKRYRGFRASTRTPVRRVFRIRDEDLKRLKTLIIDNNLLSTDALAVAGKTGGVRRYFEITLDITLDGKKGSIKISGPRDASEIKEKSIYKSAGALVEAAYKIINEQDEAIGYENRGLIN
jgi:hypothetical protein